MTQSNQVWKAPVLAIKNSQYEEQMKKRFIDILSRENIKFADCMELIISESEQSKKVADINYNLLCFKADGVYQLHQAITQVFGTVVSKDNSSPSGTESIKTIDVKLADGTRVKVPYGEIALPDLGKGAYININYDTRYNLLSITGKCELRYSSIIDHIIKLTKENLKKHSIFKGQALEIVNVNRPEIINLSDIDKQLMVLSRETEYSLRPIKARILSPERCLEKGIPLKFGALLEGGLTF